jgi:hypothetical protein
MRLARRCAQVFGWLAAVSSASCVAIGLASRQCGGSVGNEDERRRLENRKPVFQTAAGLDRQTCSM